MKVRVRWVHPFVRTGNDALPHARAQSNLLYHFRTPQIMWVSVLIVVCLDSIGSLARYLLGSIKSSRC